MAQTQLTVGTQTFSLRFDGHGCTSGTLVRLNDGLEATFNSRDCLLHLLEGVVGRRTWQVNYEAILAAVAQITPCA